MSDSNERKEKRKPHTKERHDVTKLLRIRRESGISAKADDPRIRDKKEGDAHLAARQAAFNASLSRSVFVKKTYKDFLIELSGSIEDDGIPKEYIGKIIALSIKRCYHRDIPVHLQTAGRLYRPPQEQIEKAVHTTIRQFYDYQVLTKSDDQSPAAFIAEQDKQDADNQEHLRQLDKIGDQFRNSERHIPNTESWAKRKKKRDEKLEEG